MDPTATFTELLQAWVIERNTKQAIKHAEALATWLGNGGFHPTGVPERFVDIIVDALTCDVDDGNRQYSCPLRQIRHRAEEVLCVASLLHGAVHIVGDVADFYDSVLL